MRLDNINQECIDNFAEFARRSWDIVYDNKDCPEHTSYYDCIADHIHDEKHLVIDLPIRYSKSSLLSVFLPAWKLGKTPRAKLLLVCNYWRQPGTFLDLIMKLINSGFYKKTFPDVVISRIDSLNIGTNYGGSMRGRSTLNPTKTKLCEKPYIVDMLLWDDLLGDCGRDSEEIKDSFKKMIKEHSDAHIVGINTPFLKIGTTQLALEAGHTHLSLPMNATKDEKIEINGNTYLRKEGDLLKDMEMVKGD